MTRRRASHFVLWPASAGLHGARSPPNPRRHHGPGGRRDWAGGELHEPPHLAPPNGACRRGVCECRDPPCARSPPSASPPLPHACSRGQVARRVARYLGQFEVAGASGAFTRGTQWLVWRFESDATLADAMAGLLDGGMEVWRERAGG